MSPRPKRVALYARVSTDGQSVDNQLRDLREVAERHGWHMVGEFTDRGISGAKGRDQRPAFRRLWDAMTRREVDMIAAWSVDRLGRSLQDLVGFLSELRAKDVDLFLHRQGLDTSTPAGRAMYQMLGVFSEFERAMIQDRVRAGLRKALAEGKTLGRPKVGAKIEAAIRAKLKAGVGMTRAARELGVGVSTVVRIKGELERAG
jgi:DNA invertase Pin-like site-specific DNA recombinase